MGKQCMRHLDEPSRVVLVLLLEPPIAVCLGLERLVGRNLFGGLNRDTRLGRVHLLPLSGEFINKHVIILIENSAGIIIV